MKNYSRLALAGALASGVLLGGHALYFDSTNIYLADALVFLTIVVCWGYLLKQASNNSIKKVDLSATGGHEFLKTSSSFHVQLGHEIAEQLSSAHTELGNTQAILTDAIGKLVSNFILISDGVRNLSEHTNDFSKQVREVVSKVSDSQAVAERTISKLAANEKSVALDANKHVQTVMAELAVFNEAVAKNAVQLNLISTNVEQNVLVVISTLQFQDMSSQLIEHARLRMTALQEVANEMGKGKDGSPTHKEYMEQIAAYNRLLDKHVISLNKQKANPVAQKDFGTGDIELF